MALCIKIGKIHVVGYKTVTFWLIPNNGHSWNLPLSQIKSQLFNEREGDLFCQLFISKLGLGEGSKGRPIEENIRGNNLIFEGLKTEFTTWIVIITKIITRVLFRKRYHKREEVSTMETLGQEEIELTFQNRSSSVIIGTLVNLSSCSAGKS